MAEIKNRHQFKRFSKKTIDLYGRQPEPASRFMGKY